MPTTTGFNRFLDGQGVKVANELLRQGIAIAAELNADAVNAPDAPQTFNILRRVKTSEGNPSIGIRATYETASGLDGIKGTLILPAAWNRTAADKGLPVLKDSQRVVYLVDVPGDDVLLTDRIQINDPVYGDQAFEIQSVTRNPGTNTSRAVVEFTREIPQ